jgi:stage V sporulation protein G
MRLVNDRTDRLKAFCTVTFDGEFVIRDVKVVEGPDGFFIAMPSRKLSAACPHCRHRNQVRARFCEECGKKLKPQAFPRDADSRTRMYRDIAHPITPAFREKLQTCVIDAYRAECENLPEGADYESDADFDDESSPASKAEANAKPSQYDSIIADLKSDNRSRRGPDRGEPRRSRDGDSDSPDRRPGRRRRGRDSSQRRHEDAYVSETPSEGRGEHDEASGFDRPADQPAPVEMETSGSQTTATAEAEPEETDRISLDVAESQGKTTGDSSDDTATPFGAGIV